MKQLRREQEVPRTRDTPPSVSLPAAAALERLATVGQLAAGVAHDLNNIVTVINVYARLLESEPEMGEVARQRAQAIRLQAERAAGLAWQILDHTHRSPAKPLELDLSAFLDDLVPVLRGLVPRNVDLVLDSTAPAVVLADPSALQEILANLVTNARDAMPLGGRVTIRSGPEQDRDGRGASPRVRIDVVDEGTGIPPEVLPRIFDPFFSTKPPTAGTGLGLAQVQSLVAGHQGSVEVQTRAGRGTTVTVRLPAGGRDALGPAVTDPGALPGRGEVVLLVVPHRTLRAALAELLRSSGYRVSVAGDGEEALSLLADPRSAVAAVVSEVLMPGIGGEGLARRLAELRPELPLILLATAPLAPRGEAEDGAPGEERVRLLKPFTADQLAAALDAAIRRA